MITLFLVTLLNRNKLKIFNRNQHWYSPVYSDIISITNKKIYNIVYMKISISDKRQLN